ncbi:anti-sigma factor [Thioclava litoralis]|uniref:Anti-sigma factor n=1 Tax=Thioclava litoralis TaxID=3076557 RepID=A0ABZ1DWN4_9RHOB|nr:anti-sigma factor [Thioclava sp. FTW29]
MSAAPDSDDDLLAAEQALRLLSPEEQAAFAKRAQDDPALRTALRAWETRLSALSDSFPEAAPPAALKRRLMGQIGGKTSRKSVLLWGWLASGVVALGITATFFVPNILRILTAPALHGFTAGMQAELMGADDRLLVQVQYDTGTGDVRLVQMDGVRHAADRSMELWLIPRGQAPISLGLMPENREAQMPMPENLRPMLAGATFAITDEPLGGAPAGVATGPVIAQGMMTAV